MKANLFFLAAVFAIFSSCKKNTPENVQETQPIGTVLVSGNFVSNGHATSGYAKVILDAGGKRFLVFENFRSDNGPDLRVWISPNTDGSPFQELGTLKAVNGNFSYELNPSINLTTHNRVLIWCIDFSVLFGHALLK